MYDWRTLTIALRATFSRRYFSIRHASCVLAWLAGVTLVLVPVTILRALDVLLFPGFRRQPIQAPVYIIGNPRSGTTYLHRLLCLDPQFTYLTLWQTILPALLLYRLVGALGTLDRWLGRRLARARGWLERRCFGGWDGIHATGLGRAEEDETYFAYRLMTPSIYMLWPFFDELAHLRFVDRMPTRVRARLTRYYTGNLRRHLHAAGGGKVLLAKNSVAVGRLRTLLEAMPDMRIVYIVRHPFEAVPSFIDMFTTPVRCYAPHLVPRAAAGFADLAFDYYRTMLELKRTLPPERFVEVRYEDLVADPAGVVTRIYERLGLVVSPAFRGALADELARTAGYRSTHRYDLEQCGLDEDRIYDQLREVFAHYGFERALPKRALAA